MPVCIHTENKSGCLSPVEMFIQVERWKICVIIVIVVYHPLSNMLFVGKFAFEMSQKYTSNDFILLKFTFKYL